MMMMDLTLFADIYTRRTDFRKSFESWVECKEWFYDLASKPLARKEDAPLFSPCIYKEGTTRAKSNATHIGSLIAMDVDDVSLDPATTLKDWVAAKVGGYVCLCYSTASSRSDCLKFRLVFPLTSKVTAANYDRFWYALNRHLGDVSDTQTKDISRLFYVPAQYEGGYNFIFDLVGGCFIDPEAMVLKYNLGNIRPAPQDLRSQLSDRHRMHLKTMKAAGRSRGDYAWTSYRDCPFFPRDLAAEYRATRETGWYALMYKMMIRIAFAALKKDYPITAGEVADLVRDFDASSGKWYSEHIRRDFDIEAENAVAYAYDRV